MTRRTLYARIAAFLAVAAPTQALPAAAQTGSVVTTSGLASDIGAAILARGGNAVDAAVATGFALAVTHPSAGNIGGGGFMVIRLADGRATTIDYRERAPLASTPTMYLAADGSIDRALTREGYLAAGVPGTVRGLALAHRRFGSLPWKDLVTPAAELARAGFALSPSLAEELNWLVSSTRGKYESTTRAYGRADGRPWTAGDTLRLPDLARALAAIAESGPDAFYRGWIADSVAAAMRANGGIISKADLAAYRAVERAPVRGTFLGHEIIGMAPPSSGGTAVIEMLNILERFDIANRDRLAPTTLHLMIEAQRRAFLDRAEFLGDADFGPVPVTRLTSKAHARRVAATIDTTRATSSTALARGRIVVTGAAESDETTHFSVVDARGNAVANTYTLEAGYGSRVVVSGAGFLLNNEMGDFNKKPGTTTTGGDIGTRPNRIAPGKRMLSSMSPTIVTRDGKPVLVTGSPGGRTIINTVHQIVLNVVAFRMDVRQAVDFPRFHSQWLPDQVMFETDAIPEATVAALRAMGHTIRVGGRIGDGHSIMIDPATGAAIGANDRRSPDSKASP
ncbi:MAG: gamma-glutamyltransferase [Gemmatimonadales bacterium]|nr:gamma-glutamyltransferase [Gemmatimonadales bacterium]